MVAQFKKKKKKDQPIAATNKIIGFVKRPGNSTFLTRKTDRSAKSIEFKIMQETKAPAKSEPCVELLREWGGFAK